MITAAGAGFVLTVVAVGIANGSGFLAAIVAGALGEVDFAANDGLNVSLTGFIEEIGGGEEVAVVGDGHGRHFLAGSLVEEFGSFTRTIKQAEVCVDVQMNELGIAHGI